MEECELTLSELSMHIFPLFLSQHSFLYRTEKKREIFRGQREDLGLVIGESGEPNIPPLIS